MPYVPNAADTRRLSDAIERASFSEVERIFWMIGFCGLLFLDGLIIGGKGSWVAAVGALGGFAVLYWRLRGGHLNEQDRELHGIGLRTENQRAFTALMLRQAFMGRNPLRPRVDHDPHAAWVARTEQLKSGNVETVAEEA
jgi:hypothetical protein